MPARIIRGFILFFLAAGLSLAAFYCKSPEPPRDSLSAMHSQWRNVYDSSATYVGKEVCRNCHQPTYDSFMQTGMGQSFAPATRLKSAASFGTHDIVYDKALDFYYKPYFEGDSMYVMEFRLKGRDTTYRHVQRIDYIIGSGQHTNSHMYASNGYLYQAPITFYTQKGRWDLAPGFENGGNERFSRLIELECMSCHNGFPEFDLGSQNKYVKLQAGIDCERCHGPGSLHVAARSSGQRVDTSKMPDYTIVNPRRLSTELQNNICQRCHLQGISVVNTGKTFFDFRPGMKLSEMERVFMPQYSGQDDKMIMASHVERMKKSDCYVTSNRMSCVTCHNPHRSVKVTPRSQYLNACYSCHGSGPSQKAEFAFCSEKESVRAIKNNDCVTCHMPHNGSIDIPHVAVTDHFIRKRPTPQGKPQPSRFIGLQCFNDDNPDAITRARAFMEFFERYNPSKMLLDSALRYLDSQKGEEERNRQNIDYIRAYFLRSEPDRVIGFAAKLQPEAVTDAWTCYRIGEAYMQNGSPAPALPWYQRAIAIWPRALDFQNKLGNCQLALNDYGAAEKTFRFIISENPKYALALGNLGFIYLQRNELAPAFAYFLQAVALDPDREQTLINLAVVYHGQGNFDKAQRVLETLLQRHPDSEQAKAMLADLKRS